MVAQRCDGLTACIDPIDAAFDADGARDQQLAIERAEEGRDAALKRGSSTQITIPAATWRSSRPHLPAPINQLEGGSSAHSYLYSPTAHDFRHHLTWSAWTLTG
jgi:hypothetical protein